MPIICEPKTNYVATQPHKILNLSELDDEVVKQIKIIQLQHSQAQSITAKRTLNTAINRLNLTKLEAKQILNNLNSQDYSPTKQTYNQYLNLAEKRAYLISKIIVLIRLLKHDHRSLFLCFGTTKIYKSLVEFLSSISNQEDNSNYITVTGNGYGRFGCNKQKYQFTNKLCSVTLLTTENQQSNLNDQLYLKYKSTLTPELTTIKAEIAQADTSSLLKTMLDNKVLTNIYLEQFSLMGCALELNGFLEEASKLNLKSFFEQNLNMHVSLTKEKTFREQLNAKLNQHIFKIAMQQSTSVIYFVATSADELTYTSWIKDEALRMTQATILNNSELFHSNWHRNIQLKTSLGELKLLFFPITETPNGLVQLAEPLTSLESA